MQFSANKLAALTLCGFALCLCTAAEQPQTQKAESLDTISFPQNSRPRPAGVALSPDDGLTVIAAALDARLQASRQRDCSHLVHAIYVLAGFPYAYASSSDLYAGADDFQRVTHPQPGDLVVWPGHVGIAVNPAQNVFFSRLRHGSGIDSYAARYWNQRGQVRFYRYLKSAPIRGAGTRLVSSQRRK
jgi:hypothetical protein